MWLTFHFFHCVFLNLLERVIALSEVDLHNDLSEKRCRVSKNVMADCLGRFCLTSKLDFLQAFTLSFEELDVSARKLLM